MEISKENYLNQLNKNQKEAIIDLDGPCLIVAGAGSGKTKVLTSRIVHIIREKKAYPNQILSVTFTNKAAKEMQNRVSYILKKEAIGLSWLGTFHSISAKLLRKHAQAVNLHSNFSARAKTLAYLTPAKTPSSFATTRAVNLPFGAISKNKSPLPLSSSIAFFTNFLILNPILF